MNGILVHPFPPLYDKASRILILGSFPSARSREDGFYYAHPRNRFWPMLSLIFGENASTADEKKALLYRHGIALWDSIASCRITGSADTSITDVTANDIKSLIEKTGIETIAANGTKAYEIYMRFIYEDTGIEPVKMPSTSPANASWSLERLAAVWKEVLTSH